MPVKKLTIPMEVGLCGDFRPINGDTLPDPYLMPQDRIGNPKFISVFDLRKGYQVPMKEEDKPKRAFMSNGKISVYKDAFWVKRAPATFQSIMDILLDGTHLYAAAYMDDLVVFSGSWEEHLQHVDEILQRIEQANLTLRAEKCNIGAARCIFLGHEVCRGHVAPVQAKIEAVQRFSPPITKKDV